MILPRLLLFAAALALAPSPPALAQQRSVQTVVDGLDFPAGLAFAGEGTLFVTEREGRIRVVRDGRLQDAPLTEVETTTSGETGLLGIVVSPDQRWVYAFATTPDGGSNRVVRVRVEGGEPEVVVADLPAGTYHNGGGVAFGADGMLYVSNGEQHDTGRAQDPHVLGGKVYRFTPDGDVPDDNPFGESPTYALGLRNPYGLAIDPVTGDPWVTENGPGGDDEVNHVVARANHGWPIVQGSVDDPPAFDAGRYVDPVVHHPGTIVPTGIAVAPQDAPEDVSGDVFYAGYGSGAIYRIEPNDERDAAARHEVFLEVGEPVIGMAWGSDGLYFTTQEAVKLIPFEQAQGSPTPSRSPSPATPDPSPTPRPMDHAGSRASVWLLVAIVVVIIAGAAGLWFASRRARA